MSKMRKITKIEVTTELIFILVPIIIYAVLFIEADQFIHVFFIPEWSFITLILYGQAIVKLFKSGTNNQRVNITYLRLYGAMLFLLSIISGVLLFLSIQKSMNFTPNSNVQYPYSQSLVVINLLNFALSVFLYYLTSIVSKEI